MTNNQKVKTLTYSAFMTAFIISSKTVVLPSFPVMFRKFMKISKMIIFCKYTEKAVYFY